MHTIISTPMRFYTTLALICLCCVARVSWANPVAGFTINNVPVSGSLVASPGLDVKVCVGTTLTFHSNATNTGNTPLQSVCYTFQNGTTPGPSCGYPTFGSDPPVTFNTIGKNKVMQVATDYNNTSDTLTITVEVVAYTSPDASFNPPFNSAQCASTNFTFTAKTSGLYYYWTFDSSLTYHSTQQSQTVMFDSAFGNGNSTCNVTLLVSDGVGCYASSTQKIPVELIPQISVSSPNSSPPSASYNIADSLAGIFTVCIPAGNQVKDTALQFVNNSSTFATNASYKITWGDGASNTYTNATWPLNGPPVSHIYGKGFYVMTVTTTGQLPDDCPNTKKYGVFVGSNSPVTFGHPPNTNICVGDSLKFPLSGYINNANGTFYTITINELLPFNDTLTNANLSPSGNDTFRHTFNYSSCGIPDPQYPNSFTVSIAAINACGVSPIDVKAIYVSGKSQPAIKMPLTTCVNVPVSISNNTLWSGILPACSNNAQGQWVWEIIDPAGGSHTVQNNGNLGNLSPWSPGDETLSVNFSKPGTYTVKLHVRVTASGAFQCATSDTVIQSQICVRNPPIAKFTLSKNTICAPDTVIAVRSPDANLSCSGDSTTWVVNALDSGNCYTSTANVTIDTGSSAQTAKIILPQAGKYQIVMTVTATAGGCQSVFMDTVTAHGPPVLVNPINISPSNVICSGSSIQASVTVDSCFGLGSLSYRWIFTGANAGKSDTVKTSAPPSIQYSKPSPPGLDTISYRVSNTCGAVYDTAYLTVASKPTINKIKDTSLCSGTSVNINITSPQDPQVVYSWAGNLVSGNATGITPNGSGNLIGDVLRCTVKSVVEYDITAAFAGASCPSDTLKVFDTIQPVDSAHAGPGLFLCKGITAATMAATAPATGTGTWSLVENLPVTYSNKHSPTAVVSGLKADTVYTFVWTISGTGLQCIDATDTVRISLDTIVNIVDTPSTICPGLQPIIIARQPTGGDSAAGYTAQWQLLSGGQFVNVPTPQYTQSLNSLQLPATSANGYFRRIVTAGNCSDTSNVVPVVVVTENPVPSFTPVDTGGCVQPGNSLAVNFINTTPDKNKFSYVWKFGNGQTQSVINPGTVYFSTPPGGYGSIIYYDTLVATNGCVTATFVGTDTVKSLAAALFSANTTIGCSSGPVTFTNLGIVPGVPTSFVWNFGDGTTTATNNTTVVHTYHNGPATTYPVTLMATNVCGTNTSQPLLITIDSISIGLYVNINSTEKYICTGDTVHFQNKSSGATSFVWNFGDGTYTTTTSNIQNVPHQYTNAGIYYDTVCAMNACADTCTNDSIKVGVRPVASFTLAPDSICVGGSVQFTNTSTPMGDPGIVYIWKFGDGSEDSSDVSPAHVYSTAGTDTASLIAERQFLPGFPAGFGCPDSASAVIAVGQVTGSLQYAPDSVCLSGQNVTFTVVSNTSTQNNFWFGDNTNILTANNVVQHAYTQPGKYLPWVVLTGFGGKCSATVTGADSVLVDTVNASFTLDSIPLCDSTKLTFTSNSYAYFGIKSYAWVINGVPYTNNPVLLTVNNTTGLQASLSVTGSSGCVSPTASIQGTAYVHQTPGGSIAPVSDSCSGQTVSFSANAYSNDPITQYAWIFANGDRPFGQNVSTVFGKAGTYADTLVVTTSFGCTDTIASTITIKAIPTIAISPYDSLILCRGDTTQLNASSTDSIVAWAWNPVGGLACATCASTQAYPITSTLYTVTGTSANGCTNTDSVQAAVVQPFSVSVNPDSVSICLPDSVQPVQFFASGAYTYSWSPATWLSSSTVFNPVVTIPQNQLQTSTSVVYTVTGTDQYNCFNKTATVTLNIGLTPIVTYNPGDTGVAGRVDTVYPTQALNGPFKYFNWVANGPGIITPLSGVGDTVALTINGDVTFNVTAVTNYGCTVTDTIQYYSYCNQGEQVYIPNAFSPDGDGINDVFMVQGKGIIVEEFKIFNRWGQVVFDGGSNTLPNVPANGWNGTLNGKPVNEDVYVYIVKLRCTASNISFFNKGNVTLIRVRK